MNPYYNGPKAKNYDGEVFYNPGGVALKGFVDLLKWKLFEADNKWPSTYLSPFGSVKPESHVHGDEIAITMIGHATFLIQTAGLNFLTDPVYSDRASPFQFAGPKRYNPPGIAFGDLPKIDAVLLSHNHYDHFDVATLAKLVNRDNPTIFTPLGNDTIIRNHTPQAQVQTGNWGEKFDVHGVKINFEPMHHWSARGAFDRRKALWAAFVIEAEAGNIYFVGDTGFSGGENYKAAGEKYGSFRAAILPIGAYSPRWFMKHMHQRPDEAVAGHILCKAQTSIAHHWGTFKLTNEPIEEPVELLTKALKDNGLSEDSFLALRPGQTWRA